MEAFRIVRYILQHPLSRGHKREALSRFLRWQVSARLATGPIAVPFINEARLLVAKGMTGATGNVYCGLHEFPDMAFVAHVLRAQDLFVDVGANVGAYSILAAAVAGCRCVALEPVPRTFEGLLDNIHLNRLNDRITPLNVAVADAPGRLRMTVDLDTANYVVLNGTARPNTTEVNALPLDGIREIVRPTVIKIDVEGFEPAVISGAKRTLDAPSLLAVIMETNGAGARYGHDDALLRCRMLELGFEPQAYDPFTRTLHPILSSLGEGENALFVRNVPCVRERCREAPSFCVGGVRL